ncbi:carbon-nitrogen hydrolase family protein [Rhodococcus sp. BP-349]|uniref:carbon-nitrogen hydrolase family protein n=1 Tax=unclassified Rhodococcus (in: high G+C Gram-positive bacteria) TaxID=192944 RepID=UPI001C9A4321|nr:MULTISPECIES: carbon-nitrogen hydrolase family protein [unclassified Rhodococcus (in: high G+C Gram-positive bacteria)]MBY6539340.1 carbon-nitrogen hydrolase family protein [Rhodococcus sp. BP-363]MBY6544332.1 carbon-nitrogen hydrolase family protein [Rhodococcus sp. BP-369]MBY6563562.1 carbon-nitrogen hydrolase family protein [Rhodococcus sp. BP-370]MBY6577854.1 carbon-nitrogen hydrolase family protein [Rhodococcus sp. BP-364]MBY6587155.1 carbon-nitrogen hydrolase family protein [Rhodococc
MAPIRAAALAGHFGRDVERSVEKIVGIIEQGHQRGIDLLVLPDACLGGYLGDLARPDLDELPPALDEDGPELAVIAAAAGAMTVCVGYTERAALVRYNAAVCLTGDGVVGRHRKVHQPAGESLAYAAGDRFSAFDTPVGRMGMLIDYDKTFPEAARTLALDGARIIAALSAWPASVTDRASKLANDRQSRLFDLYDAARAAENQVVLLSSNHTGVTGSLRFLGQAKIVGPGGEVLCRTRDKGGLACCDIDVDAEVDRARRVLRHLDERRPDTYHSQASKEITCVSPS